MRRTAVTFSIIGLSFLVFAGCASTDWESRYLEKENESRALQEQYEAMNQEIAEREATDEELRQSFLDTQQNVEVLSQTLADLRTRPAPKPMVDPSVGEAARLQAEVARLEKQYGEYVRLTQDGNIEITLNSDVTFAAGSYALTKNGKSVLDTVARELTTTFAKNMVEVTGHTDADPIKKSPFKDNWELGAERALEVTRYLSSAHGIDQARLVASSRGETMPIAENTSKSGKKKNRRVEIVVVIPRRNLLAAVAPR